MIPIHDLIISQETLRDPAKLVPMMEHVKKDLLWLPDECAKHAQKNGGNGNPIYIARFPNGLMLLHDGHTRATATLLGGRDEFSEEEVVLKNWTYESYLTINWDVGYVTPHDPRTEVRLPEFFEFKKTVLEMAKTDKVKAENHIWMNRHKYAKPRCLFIVRHLVNMYSENN
jgi:hypothetical protein